MSVGGTLVYAVFLFFHFRIAHYVPPRHIAEVKVIGVCVKICVHGYVHFVDFLLIDCKSNKISTNPQESVTLFASEGRILDKIATYHIGVKGADGTKMSLIHPWRSVCFDVSIFSTGAPSLRFSLPSSMLKTENWLVNPK